MMPFMFFLLSCFSKVSLAQATLAQNDGDDYQPTYQDSPSPKQSAGREYRFGVFPLHNPVRLFDVYQPMVAALNAVSEGYKLKLEASKDYPSYERKIFSRELDIAIINPYQAIKAEAKGYRIFAKMGDDDRMRGIIVVRKDAGIKSVYDLRGATISFPAPTAMAASIMTKMFMMKQGLDVHKEANPIYVGSQDSAVMNVYQGKSKAGCTWPPTWDALTKERPEVTSALEIKWRTESLPSLALVARDDIPVEHVAAISKAVTSLHNSAEGRKILEAMTIPKYEPADSSTYEPVRVFMKEYVLRWGDTLAGGK